MDQIHREGAWWTRDLVGGWLRYNPVTSQWEPSAISPPPPPPPPPGYVAPVVAAEVDPVDTSDFPYDSSIYVPLPKKSRSEQWRQIIARLDPRVAVAGAVVFALLLFGGVGWAVFGDGTQPTSAVGASLAGDTRKLTPKQKFIRAADGLCADIMTATRKLSTTPTTLGEATAIMNKARGILERAIKRGHAIKAPPTARAGWKRFVGGRGQLRVFDEMMSALVRGDVATVQRLEGDINEQAARERRWAKRYGMKVCSQKL
jgi:hypothetical protein